MRQWARTILAALICGALVFAATGGNRAFGQELVVNGESCGAIDGLVTFSQDGSIFVDTFDGCTGVEPDPCAPPEGFRVLSSIELERNNVINYRCDDYASCFDGWPGASGNAYRLRLNRMDIASLPVSVTEGTAARFLFEGNVDISDSVTVTLAGCEGGAYFPAGESCSRSFGQSGGVFSFGSDPGRALCVVDPGDYHLVIVQADAVGEPGCGGDQLCTVFFGVTGFE